VGPRSRGFTPTEAAGAAFMSAGAPADPVGAMAGFASAGLCARPFPGESPVQGRSYDQISHADAVVWKVALFSRPLRQ
jgi:hypothetical protein